MDVRGHAVRGRCVRQDTQGGLAGNADACPRGNLTTTMNPTFWIRFQTRCASASAAWEKT